MLIAVTVAFLTSSVAFAQLLVIAPPAANLDQVRNGAAGSPVSPGNWVNGNAGPSQAHYVEGFSIPYRVVMTDLPLATPITLTMGFDIKHSNRHAVDYLTHYDRLEPHVATFGHAAEVIDPLIGVSGVSVTIDTEPIPVPDTTNSPVPGQPAISFNALPAGERVMTLFGGTISSVSYATNGDLTAAQSETRITVAFQVDSSTAVLAWGGHIGSRNDWGFDGSEPRSAGGISGSPYHMRLISWNLNNLGNQDRSLSAGAIVDPCESVVCPGSTGPCDAGQACDSNTGSCVDLPDPANGTPCEADGSLCTADTCNGSGACVTVNTVTCPGPSGPCDGGTECDPQTGGCVPLSDPVFSTPCDADGDQCTQDHCDGLGNCVFLADVVCPPSGQCETISCNSATGNCDVTPKPLSTACEADGDLCTIDHCDGFGGCVTLNTVSCQPANPPCEGGQLCNPNNGQCEDRPDATLSTPCERDSNLCTVDHCNGTGSCVTYDNVVCAGSGNPCDAGEQCEPATGNCVSVLDPPLSTPCEADGDLCTLDHCDGAGSCVFDEDVVCPPGDQCRDIICNSATGNCDVIPKAFSTTCELDGNLCTIDHCDGMGNCVPLDQVECPYPGQCNTTACDPGTGTCPITPKPLSTECEADGNLCTIDHCDGQGACVQLGNVGCQAATQCDGGSTCNPATGGCDPDPDPELSTPCEADGNLCTIDHCDGMGGCVLLDRVVCQDPDPPCDGGQVCNPGTGQCDDLPDAQLSTACELDGDLCTIDHCDGLGSCVLLDVVDCSDLVDQCNDAACIPATGECDVMAKPFSTECERDGSLCTIDHCDGQGSCVELDRVVCPSPVPPCEGGQACNRDTGLCEDLPDAQLSTECEVEGDLCTRDHCDGSGNCVFLEAVVCQDADPPCEGGQTCNSGTGLCDDLPDAQLSTPCEADGDACTQDHCDGSGACVLERVLCGACCDGNTGGCVDDSFPEQCVGDQRSFFLGRSCDQISCVQHTGACCNLNNPPGGDCVNDVLPQDCAGDGFEWTKDTSCDEVKCFVVIPTVSEWGMIVLALLLLCAAKVYYGFRREPLAT